MKKTKVAEQLIERMHIESRKVGDDGRDCFPWIVGYLESLLKEIENKGGKKVTEILQYHSDSFLK